MTMKIDKIPEELLENRKQVECNFVFSLYKDPDLYYDYSHLKIDEDFIIEDTKFYFTLGQNLLKAGFQTFDAMAFNTYLADKEAVRKEFEHLGGFSSIQDIISLTSVENVESYYDELVKSNMLIRLNSKGFNVIKNLDRFKLMSSEALYDWYEYQLADIAVGKISKVEIENLSDGYDEWMERMNKGVNNGYKIGSYLLDKQLAGIHKGLTLYAGGIGQGKSSSAIPLFVLPAIEHGNDICIICNEQTSDEYRTMIMATVLFSRLKGVQGLNRQKLTKGNFTEEQKKDIKRASEWISNQPGKIRFVELDDYDTNKVRKIIKKESKCGCGYFIFDVLKSVNNSDEKAWAVLLDTSQTLATIAKNDQLAIVATVQLASDSMFRHYLDLSSIGKSRGMSECATTVIGFRPVFSDEYDKIKPYKYKYENGEKKGKEEVTLNTEKHYIIQFVMKNRWGDVSEQIVQEFNQNFNTLFDVGYYRVPYDNFRR